MTISRCSLVLTGGGARGAYQAGVLSAVSELLGSKLPLSIISGVSAGAINAAVLASYANDFQKAAKKLAKIWNELNTEMVYRSDILSLSQIGMKWIGSRSMGGVYNSQQAQSILDNDPLVQLILDSVDFDLLRKNIDMGIVKSLAVSAFNYNRAQSITFVDSSIPFEPWQRGRRKGYASKINCTHLMASSAIPLLFPPIELEGNFYGDGALRNTAPLSSSIHLGANKIFMVGVRSKNRDIAGEEIPGRPGIGRILGMMLNSIFFDTTDIDVRRLNRINEVVRGHNSPSSLKPIDLLWIRPSKDLGEISIEMKKGLPKLIRYLLKGLGSSEDNSELVSYLLFDSKYTKTLVELGYRDAIDRKEEIIEFLVN